MKGQRSSQIVNPTAFQLKNLHIDPSIGLVSGSEGSVHLEPRVMAVLQALVRRPGELVSRAELLAEIWPGGSIYDEALTQCVYQLRQQLASAGGSEYRNLINTIPKRGYVLNSDVQLIDFEPGPVQTLPTRSAKRLVIVGVLATLLAGAVFWTLFKWDAGTGADAGPVHAQTLAVLPFLPLVENNRDPSLELGMADTLIARLSGSRAIIVRPITSVRRYASMERNSLLAGRELGVNAVVEGSIQRSGEVMRVSVRLLRTADGTALWADTFNEKFSDIFSVQDDICERIANALVPELGRRNREALTRRGTSNAAAYESYLKGRYHLSRLTPADMRTSIEYFREAVALDPGYARAWLGLASVQFRIPLAGEAPPMEFYPNARLAAQKALEIDPTLAEGYAMLGWIANWFEWDWALSESHFRHAIELDPNDTESHLGYAQLLGNTGRVEQALIEVRRARELSPFYMVAAALEGGFLMRANRPEEALQRLEEALRQDENFWLTRTVLAGTYLSLGRKEDALTQVREARRLSQNGSWATVNEISMLVLMGRHAEAESLAGEIVQRSANRYVPLFDLACVYRLMGDSDTALATLLRAYEVRDPKIALLGTDHGWDSFKDRPGFNDLMRRLNLPDPPLGSDTR